MGEGGRAECGLHADMGGGGLKIPGSNADVLYGRSLTRSVPFELQISAPKLVEFAIFLKSIKFDENVAVTHD